MKKLKLDGGVTRLRSHNAYVGEAMGRPRSWVGKGPILRPNGKHQVRSNIDSDLVGMGLKYVGRKESEGQLVWTVVFR